MKRLIIPFLLMSAVLVSSCKKKKHSDPEEELPSSPMAVTYPDYAKLKIGNYWIYQRFQIDENQNVTALPQTDSVYIFGDTLIRNRKFFRMHRHDYLFNRDDIYYMADSLHYVIGADGGIFFSSEDFTKVFKEGYNIEQSGDTILHFEIKMDDRDKMINVPAGSFITCALKTTYFIHPPYAPPALSVRSKYNRYAKNVGLISETEDFFATVSYYTERRLIRYHLN